MTKHVPDYTLVVGNPARQMGWMSEYGHRLSFNDAGVAFCPESGEKYAIANDKVVKL